MDVQIESIITQLEIMIETSNTFLKLIRYPCLVIEGLKDLRSFVGMNTIKLQIVRTIKSLIVNQSKIQSRILKGLPATSKKPYFNHIILGGPPGTGKTHMGKVLCKIIIGLGIVKKRDPIKQESKEENLLPKIIAHPAYCHLVHQINYFRNEIATLNYKLNTTETNLKENKNTIINMCTTLKEIINKNGEYINNLDLIINNQEVSRLITHLKSINNLLQNVQSNQFKKDIDNLFYLSNNFIMETNKDNNISLSNQDSTLIQKIETQLVIDDTEPIITPLCNNYNEIPDQLPFKIFTRDMLVGQHLGHTSCLTKKAIEDSLGGVMFIDEAYNMYHLGYANGDAYGLESLTLLCDAMSTNADQLVVIFSGYIDKMEETILKFQPGLRRRIRWNFQITEYTPIEIAEIFRRQLLDEFHQFDPKFDIEAFFKNNYPSFPHFGGDTQNLVAEILMVHNNRMFESVTKNMEPDNIITEKDVLAAFNIFEQLKSHVKCNTEAHLPMYG
jgi:DNA polymerase III delta prime subunit